MGGRSSEAALPDGHFLLHWGSFDSAVMNMSLRYFFFCSLGEDQHWSSSFQHRSSSSCWSIPHWSKVGIQTGESRSRACSSLFQRQDRDFSLPLSCPFCRGLFSKGELYFTTRAARKGFGQWMDFIEGQKAKKTVQQAQKPKATGQGSRGQAHKNQ